MFSGEKGVKLSAESFHYITNLFLVINENIVTLLNAHVSAADKRLHILAVCSVSGNDKSINKSEVDN